MFGQQNTVGNNKQVCSYFMKGTCKYGTRCWNLHPTNQGGSGLTGGFAGGARPAAPTVFGSVGFMGNHQQDSKEFQEFVKQVSGEMNHWERSGQWLLSSFSPLKGHPPISGFSDLSAEELRLQGYQALQTNTSADYQAQWREVQQQYRQLRDELKNPTKQAVTALRDVFYTKTGLDQEQQQQQPFKPANVFGKPAGQTAGFSAFSSQPSSSSSSGSGGAGLLGAKPGPSLFGGAPSVFGGSTQTTTPSIFGTATTNKSVFAAQPTPASQNTSSTFGTQNSNIFGIGSTMFGSSSSTPSQTNTNLFGGSSQAQATSSSIFGGGSNPSTTSQASSIFGGAQSQNATASNLFGNNNSTTLFGGGGVGTSTTFQPTQAGGTSTAPPTTSHSIFGNQSQPQQQQGGVFSPQPTQQQQQLFGMQTAYGGSENSDQAQGRMQSMFGGASSGTVFGNSTTTSTTTSGSSIFGGSSSSSGLLNAQPSPLSTSTATTSLLGQQLQSPQPGSGNTTLFGKSVNVTQNLHTVASGQSNAAIYTPLDQLDAKDREQFEAAEFTAIPLCPPPLELCS